MPRRLEETLPMLEAVLSRLGELERRVAALEKVRPPEPIGLPSPAASFAGVATQVDWLPSGMLPVAGKALLGIAGAYVLRAIAESGVVPTAVVALAGLAYAAVWLAWAARLGSQNRFGMVVYAITAALIVSPLLWETTVRFRVLPPMASAAALCLFVLAGSALAWKDDLQVLAWITMLAGTLTALTLLLATHDLIPFTTALVAIGAIVEAAACRDHWLSERWVPAIAADLAMWLLAYTASRPQGLPEGYAPISTVAVVVLQAALLVVYAGSAIYRTLHRRLPITVWEIVQMVAALLLSIGGFLRVLGQQAAPVFFIAALCVTSGAGCYAASLLRLLHEKGRRNSYVYAAFGCLLLICGTALALKGPSLPAAWSVFAIAVTLWESASGSTRFRCTGWRTRSPPRWRRGSQYSRAARSWASRALLARPCRV